MANKKNKNKIPKQRDYNKLLSLKGEIDLRTKSGGNPKSKYLKKKYQETPLDFGY